MADPSMPDPGADPTAGSPGADDQGTDDQGGAQNVLLTVLKNDDGTYTLIDGDEDEGSSGADVGAAPGGSGATPQGQTFDSVGALLKGILDCVKKDEASASGEGTEDQNFDAGYSGGSVGAATTKQPPASMRS